MQLASSAVLPDETIRERVWRIGRSRGFRVLGVAAIVLVGGALRFGGLGRGLPYATGVDEPQIMNRVVEMMRTGDFNPHFFDYPGLYLYLQLFVACVRFLAGAIAGLWRSLAQVSPIDFYEWGRALTALLGTATVALVYAIGRRWSIRHGLLAAALFAFMPNHVRESHFVLTDVPMTFFVGLTFLLTLQAVEKGTLRAFAWAGAAAGLATGTKYYGGLVVSLPLLAAWFAPPAGCSRARPWLAATAAFAVAFLAVAPYTVLDLPGFLDGMAYLFGSAVTRRPAGADPGWLIYTKHLRLALGWPGFVLMLAGALLGVVRSVSGPVPSRQRHALLVVFPLIYFYLVATRSLIFARYLLPILPFVSLLVSAAIISTADLAGRLKVARPAQAVLGVGLVLAALVPPSVTSLSFVRSLGTPSTYELAGAWVQGHLPAGARIASEDPVLILPGRYSLEREARLIDRSYEDYWNRGVRFLVASSRAEAAFAAPQLQPREYAAYRRLFDQSALLATIPAADRTGPEIRIFRLGLDRVP